MDSLFLFIRTVPPGCTNPSAPNYNAWAIHDDGSCVHGTRVVFEVNPNGQWASYQVEGPGFYYGDIVGPANEGDYSEDADGHIIEFTAWPQVIYTGIWWSRCFLFHPFRAFSFTIDRFQI